MGDTSTPSRNESGNATGNNPAIKHGSSVSRAGQRILASMLRRADIQSVDVESADARTLSIEEVDIGDASVERFSLRDIRTLVDTGRVTMNNVRSIVDLSPDDPAEFPEYLLPQGILDWIREVADGCSQKGLIDDTQYGVLVCNIKEQSSVFSRIDRDELKAVIARIDTTKTDAD